MSLKKIDLLTSRLVFGTVWPNKVLIWAHIRHIFQKIMFNCIKNSHHHVNHLCWNDHIGFWISKLFSLWLCWFEIIIQTFHNLQSNTIYIMYFQRNITSTLPSRVQQLLNIFTCFSIFCFRHLENVIFSQKFQCFMS